MTVGHINWGVDGTAGLAASLLRPFVLAGAAWLVLRLFRIRHPASQHTIWTGVAAGMLLLPILSSLVPQWKLPVLPAKHASVTSAPVPIPLTPVELPAEQAPAHTTPTFKTLLPWFYLAGLFARIAYRATGWAMLRRLIAKSKRMHGRVWESADVITPITVGVLHPIVILPSGWREWNLNTRRAILAHEFAHIRRRDGLTSMLARWITCIFWYHPIAWLVAQRISETAESACDAMALEGVRDPIGYSRVLLAFAEKVHLAGYRVALPGLAIATPSGLAKRIDQVFELSRGNLRKLRRPGLFLAVLGTPLMCLAATAGLGERTLLLLSLRPPLPPSLLLSTLPSVPLLQIAQAQPQSASHDEPPLRSLTETIANQIPSPPGLYLDQDLEAYHQRQAYADAHFSFPSPGSSRTQPGQFSSRGQAYVRFGPPDSIEEHSATADTPAYQLWRYKHVDDMSDNIVLEFVDAAGTGQYPEAAGPGLPVAYSVVGALGQTTFHISVPQGVGAQLLSGTISSALGSTVTTFEELAPAGQFSKTIPLAPGAYKLTLEIKDQATGVGGASEYKFQVN